LQRLTEIAEAYAHPWMDFYPPAPASEYEGWYEQY
jgi:hypothetical protein